MYAYLIATEYCRQLIKSTESPCCISKCTYTFYDTAAPFIDIIETQPLNSTSFTVSWTITDPHYNYMIIWTNLRTGVKHNIMVSENITDYTVTGLNGVDNYNVSVTANNLCGLMMTSDSITVYSKDVMFYAKHKEITIGRIIFEDIKFGGYSKFHFK